MADKQIDTSNNRMDIEVKKKIYPLDSVLTAAYVFIDKAYIFLDYEGDDKIKISFKGKEEMSAEDFRALEGEFENELLHQVLRTKLTKKNKIREMIISQALFSLKPTEEEVEIEEETEQELKEILSEIDDGEDTDYLEDPLGIAVSWEDKKKGGEKSGKDG